MRAPALPTAASSTWSAAWSWDTLPRELADTPSLETFETRLVSILSNLGEPDLAGGLD